MNTLILIAALIGQVEVTTENVGGINVIREYEWVYENDFSWLKASQTPVELKKGWHFDNTKNVWKHTSGRTATALELLKTKQIRFMSHRDVKTKGYSYVWDFSKKENQLRIYTTGHGLIHKRTRYLQR